MTMIVVGRKRERFVVYFAGNAQKAVEGATKEEAISKLILEQGEDNNIFVENE